jgi:hypothetical protein
MIKETNWANTKKTFRHLNRVQYTHPNLPIAADITILRNSSKYGKDMVPTYTVQDAKVFENDVSYEIELEILNNRVRGTQYAHSPSLLLNELRKMIRIILSAIQGTNYPIGEQEMRSVLKSYHKLVHGSNADNQKCSFIGPSSYTLQIENLVDTGNTVPNVLHNYTVTDKADGERKLLFVDGSGRLYLIDTSLRVQFTGTRTDHKKLTNSLFDGEHIKHDKYGKFINVFAIFDIYYVNNESVREYPFTRSDNHASLVEKGVPLPKYYRLALMNALPGKLNPVSVLDSRDNMAAPCPLRLKCKEFYSTESSSIFGICDKLFKQIEDGLFEYNTDGLIFTPSEYGVGGGPNMKSGPLFKHTWTRSFKWKPSEYNTIDFLVRVQKDENGKDRVKTIFSDGGIVQYKTLVLHCGFDPTKHEQSNPFQQLLDGNFEMKSSQSDESEAVQARVSTYRAKPFSPTNPADARACLCNIKLEKNAADNTFYMTTEEGGYFEENMIVEFKYDQSAEGAWRWKPLRVRHDKTKQTNGLCDGGFNYNRKPRESFGNDFTTANNNWYSIHNPITSQMLITGIFTIYMLKIN